MWYCQINYISDSGTAHNQQTNGAETATAVFNAAVLSAGEFAPKVEQFTGSPGLKVNVDGTSKIEIFKIIFTDRVVDILVEETNHYAQQCIKAAPTHTTQVLSSLPLAATDKGGDDSVCTFACRSTSEHGTCFQNRN